MKKGLAQYLEHMGYEGFLEPLKGFCERLRDGGREKSANIAGCIFYANFCRNGKNISFFSPPLFPFDQLFISFRSAFVRSS